MVPKVFVVFILISPRGPTKNNYVSTSRRWYNVVWTVSDRTVLFELDRPDKNSAIFQKGDYFVTSYLLYNRTRPSEKGSTLKGKNWLPEGANSSLLE